MNRYRVEMVESKSIYMDVEALSEENARNIAEEQYYAESTQDDELKDFYVNDVTQLDDTDTSWAI